MKRRPKSNSFKKLEQEWYAKIAATPDANGEKFVDIEDTMNPSRPLKEWHSRKFRSQRSRQRQIDREKYDQQIANFINSKAINEICELIVKHGNSSLTASKVKLILEFHRGGLTERSIARKLKCGKKCVHITLKKAKEWMKVA